MGKNNISKKSFDSNWKPGVSEDCLYLNIWAPKEALEKNKKFPVMVYFHGGAYFFGNNNWRETHGQVVADRQKVIVVRNFFNNRLETYNQFSIFKILALKRLNNIILLIYIYNNLCIYSKLIKKCCLSSRNFWICAQ